MGGLAVVVAEANAAGGVEGRVVRIDSLDTGYSEMHPGRSRLRAIDPFVVTPYGAPVSLVLAAAAPKECIP
jgi:hypothetical protein